MYSVQRESLIDHRGCDGRPALCARSQVRSDGKRTAQCDHRMGDFDRCTHQRSLAGKAEVCCMGCDFWRDGDCHECGCTNSPTTKLDRADEYRLWSFMRSVRGAELGMTVQDWE